MPDSESAGGLIRIDSFCTGPLAEMGAREAELAGRQIISVFSHQIIDALE